MKYICLSAFRLTKYIEISNWTFFSNTLQFLSEENSFKITSHLFLYFKETKRQDAIMKLNIIKRENKLSLSLGNNFIYFKSFVVNNFIYPKNIPSTLS